MIKHERLLVVLESHIAARYGSVTALAKHWGVSEDDLREVRAGRQAPGQDILVHLERTGDVRWSGLVPRPRLR